MSKLRSVCHYKRVDWLGRKLCACGCPRLVPKHRVRWATDECYDRANPSVMRNKVKRRDKGVCAICGVNTVRMRERCPKLWTGPPSPNHYDDRFREGGDRNGRFLRERFDRAGAINKKWASKWRRAADGRRNRLRKAGWPLSRDSWWDADHVIPVVEGGGLCGLENYRTLCVPCHKAGTAALAARRARSRRVALQPEFLPAFV